jgi:hypothetical protein
MIVLEQKSNVYIASLILGLLYRLTLCGFVCFTYIIDYFAGIESGFKKEVIVTSIYNKGCIRAYTIIGTIAVLVNHLTILRTWVSRIGRVALDVLPTLYRSLLNGE